MARGVEDANASGGDLDRFFRFQLGDEPLSFVVGEPVGMEGRSVRYQNVTNPMTTGGIPSRINTQRHPASPAQWTFSRIQRERGMPKAIDRGCAIMK